MRPEVGEQDAVDPAVSHQPSIAVELICLRHHLKHQGVSAAAELCLDAGDEGREEGVFREDLRRSRDDQPEGESAGRGQRSGSLIRGPAQVRGRLQDPLAGVRSDPGSLIQSEGDRAFGDTGGPGNIGDGDPAATHPQPPAASSPTTGFRSHVSRAFNKPV